MAAIVFKGGDRVIEITLQNPDLTAFNLTGVLGVVAHLKDKFDTILTKWSKNPLPGYDSLTLTDALNGKFEVLLQSAKTVNAEPGVYVLDIKVQETNADFDYSTQDTEGTILNFIEIKENTTDTIDP